MIEAQEKHEEAIAQTTEAYKKIMRILSNGLQMLGPAGNQRGDRFYLRLSYKRVNGKWRVKK